MKYQYQLILLGNYNSYNEALINLLLLKLNDLGLKNNIFNIIDRDNFNEKYSGNQPAFAIYYGSTSGNHKDIEITKNLILDGTMILPVFFNDGNFSNEIPKLLEHQNGILYKKIEMEKIVNIILESFELLRSSRKIFISYRRNESTSIAIQLFESLEAQNFDVFLDTHSVKKGDSFQDELWHRMTDCDVIVLLNTPNFLESKWCKEELAEAGVKQIGIVQLIWPNHSIHQDLTSHLSYPIQLNQNSFINGKFNNENDSKLTDVCIDKVANKIESVRARNLAARQDNLITEFRNIATKIGKEVIVQPEGFLSQDFPCGKKIIYIPAIGIPQSTSCQSAEIKKEVYGYKGNNLVLRIIYDDMRIREKWLNHLDWLNDNFKKDIKTLKKIEFESWLIQN